MNENERWWKREGENELVWIKEKRNRAGGASALAELSERAGKHRR